MSRHTRAFSSLSRSILRSRSTLNDHDSTIRIQRVRFKKPPLVSWQSFGKLTAFVSAGIAFEVILSYHEYKEWKRTGQGDPQPGQNWKGLFGDGKSQSIEEQVQGSEERGQSEEEEDENSIVPEEQPEDAIFIPLGWVRQCEQTYYKSNDPEWKSFVEFAVNRDRNEKVRRELAGLVGLSITQGKAGQKLLGKDIRIGKYWIDVDYPDGPPREYERGGLEIADEYVAWVVRPVPAHNYSRLLRALWPEPIAQSLWSSYNLLWTLQLAKIKNYLNINTEKQNEAPKTPDPSNGVSLSPAKQDSSGTAPSPVSALPLPANAQPSEQPDSASSSITNIIKSERRLRSPLPAADMRSATSTFRQTLARRWKPLKMPAPRGSVYFSGLVEVSGSRALCVLDVRAFYHPVEAKWVAINIAVRRVQKRKQRARGGD